MPGLANIWGAPMIEELMLLEEQITQAREELVIEAMKHNFDFLHENVLKKSVALDKMLNLYHKIQSIDQQTANG